MPPFPSDRTPDSSLALLSQGYRFTLDRYARLNTDAFVSRIMLTSALVARGADAAQMFYTPGRFTRRGGIPKTTLWSLQDEGSVMTLDGAVHTHRKAMFMALFGGEAPRTVADRFEAEWMQALPRFRDRGETVLLHMAREVLTRSFCAWAGAPLMDAEVPQRVREFGAMVDGAGSLGFRNWWGLMLRRRTEHWARQLVEAARHGTIHPPEDSPLAIITHHRDLDGSQLDLRTAGVELVNCIRPAVANDRYIVFAAHALHLHPEARAALGEGEDEAALDCFANEVRRYYPFIPMMGGRTLGPFDWRGRRFKRGDWVLFDLHGTNHDPRLWHKPERFDPERFRKYPPGAYDLVSHGAGNAHLTHRCPGEAMTQAIIKRATRLLLRTDYEVPPQDLSIDLSYIPAVPRSRFRMTFR